MSIEALRKGLPAYARDIKINLGRILSEDGTEGLSPKQTYAVALACAYAVKNSTVINAFYDGARAHLSESEIEATKAAATIMAMNNVYYRFVHLVSDKEYG